LALHEGDKVQLHASVLGDVPRYVYMYWYDVDGKPKRLWPKEEEIDHQRPVTHVDLPGGKDQDLWYAIDAQRGAETLLVAVRDQPLAADTIRELDKLSAYASGDIKLDDVFHIASDQLSKEISRGLGGVVQSLKNPLSGDFQQ